MKACRRTRQLLERSFDGRLTLDEEFRLEEHAHECDACRRLFEEHERLCESLLNLPSPPVERLDVERSLQRIHAALDESVGAGDAPEAHRAPWWRSASAAVAASLALGALYFANRPGAHEAPGEPVGTGDSVVAAPAEVTPAPRNPAVARVVDPAPARHAVFAATDLDRVRLASARAEVRELFRRAALELTPDAPAAAVVAFADRFEELAGPLLDSSWPVGRIAERLVVSTPDPIVACAAARYLGVRGSDASVGALVEALALEDRKQAATLALFDAGERGRAGLARAVWDPDLHELVVERAVEFAPAGCVAWVREALACMPRGGSRAKVSDLAGGLLRVLSGAGAAGARSLLGLAHHPAFGEADVIEALAATEDAGAAVTGLLEAHHSPSEIAFLLRAVDRLHPPGAVGWVAQQCRSRRYGGRAFRILATFGGDRALFALLDPRVSGRASAAELRGVWRLAIDHDLDRIEDLARRIADASELEQPRFGRRLVGRRLLEALVFAEHPRAVPAIFELVGGDLLQDDDRERALLAAAAFAGDEHYPQLRELFRGLDSKECDLAAACVITAHSLLGEPAVRDLLSEVPARRQRSILALLSRPGARGGTAVTLFKLAHELEPVLGSRAGTERISP
ncbi:MAG: zf-HC2 domain-containing protein [Planctomycetota bacterium]|nr:MAG: zf-HC2 domain-containing protein [Planctomycetota bacterium]